MSGHNNSNSSLNLKSILLKPNVKKLPIKRGISNLVNENENDSLLANVSSKKKNINNTPLILKKPSNTTKNSTITSPIINNKKGIQNSGSLSNDMTENMITDSNNQLPADSVVIENNSKKLLDFDKSMDDNSSQHSNSSSVFTISNTTDSYPPNMFKFKSFLNHHLPPYILHVQPIKDEIRTLNPSYVGKLIISKFPNNISELYSVNRKKVAIIIDNKITANKLIEEPIFGEKGLKIFIPFHIYSKQIVVKNVDLNISMNEVVSFGITEGNMNILSARRLNRRVNSGTEVSYIPSSSILITIDSRVLPKHFLLHRIRYNVVPYKPKPKQCFNCFKFGHLKNGCRFKSICIHCGLSDHNSVIYCPSHNKEPSCVNCKGAHKANDSDCPYRIKQYQIFDIAFEKNISIDEARQLIYDSYKKPTHFDFPSTLPLSIPKKISNKVSFADVAKNNLTNPIDISNSVSVDNNELIATLIGISNFINEALKKLTISNDNSNQVSGSQPTTENDSANSSSNDSSFNKSLLEFSQLSSLSQLPK